MNASSDDETVNVEFSGDLGKREYLGFKLSICHKSRLDLWCRG